MDKRTARLLRRLPPCEQHPEMNEVRSVQRRQGGANGWVQLTTHHCAAGSCGRAIGWEFTLSEGLNRSTRISGAGRCQDERIEQAFSRYRYDSRTATMVAIAVLASAMTFIASLMLMAILAITHDYPFRTAPIGALLATTLPAAITHHVYRRRRRNRPAMPEFDTAASPTPQTT